MHRPLGTPCTHHSPPPTQRCCYRRSWSRSTNNSRVGAMCGPSSWPPVSRAPCAGIVRLTNALLPRTGYCGARRRRRRSGCGSGADSRRPGRSSPTAARAVSSTRRRHRFEREIVECLGWHLDGIAGDSGLVQAITERLVHHTQHLGAAAWYMVRSNVLCVTGCSPPEGGRTTGGGRSASARCGSRSFWSPGFVEVTRTSASWHPGSSKKKKTRACVRGTFEAVREGPTTTHSNVQNFLFFW